MIRRGELWRYQPVIARAGASTIRLVISDDSINDTESATIVGLCVVDADPGSLLAPQVADDMWVVVTMIERVLKSRLIERLGRVDDPTMENVETTLKAALGLP